MAEQPNKQPFKVFFIASNQTSLDDKLNYSLKRGDNANFQLVISKIVKYKREDFSIYVFCFDIITKDLDEFDKDKEKKLYKAIIKLQNKDNIKNPVFEGKIFFKETQNNFIYDFEFEETESFINTFKPPLAIRFNKTEQLKLFCQAMTKLKIKQTHKPFIDLIMTSQKFLIGQKFTFDFFLQIMKSCFYTKEVLKLLRTFNFNKFKLPDYEFDPSEYKSFLNSLEKNPRIITKHCLKTDNPEKFNKIIYSLLLYFKLNYDKEKIHEFLLNQELRKYFIEILPNNYVIFQNIEIPEELVNEMIKQNDLTFNIIKGTFFYLKTFEKILLCINENIDKIYNICTKEKKEIKINELTGPKPEDNVEKICEEIEKIIKYESSKIKFVKFDGELFNNYIHYYFKKDLKNLLLLKKAILCCKKLDNELDPDYNSYIHTTAIEMIKNGKLKNLELLDFIENDDIYFIEDKQDYKNISYRPLSIFDGFDLESMDEKFFEKWKKINLFQKYSFLENEMYAEKYVIDKLKNMKDLGKLLKIFNFDNEKLCKSRYVSLITDKYKKILKTYTNDTCPNFVKETSLIIYILDKKLSSRQAKNFMEKNIEKDIPSKELINDIYLNLSSNEGISREIVSQITKYFIKNLKNKNALKGENLLFLLKKINSVSIITSILNEISNYSIKEKELFNEEKEIDSFKLLDGLIKEDLIEKYPLLNETSYISSIINLEDKVKNDIKNGNIKYNIIGPWYRNIEKRNILKERLSIIFLYNENDVKECMDAIKEYCNKIIIVTAFISKLRRILIDFYQIKHSKDIKELDKFDKELKEGMMNVITKEEIQNKKEKFNKLLPNLEKIEALRRSKFFKDFFANLKKARQLMKEDEIFKQTEDKFKKLKLLFEPNWVTIIEESIIKECYKTIKGLEEKEIENQLDILKKYFKLNIDGLQINKIKDELIIFSKKEEIFQLTNSCLYFIQELEATPTDFSVQLNKLRDDISKNISVDKIREYGKSLEKYGINILNPKPQDRDYLDILSALYNKKGSLKLIVNITPDQCRHLQEVVSESENTFLTVAEIQDMEKCSKFMNIILGDKNVKKTDIDLISSLIKEVINEKNISVFFIQYANNSGQIQELFSQKLDKSQTTLKQIKNILKESNFTLSIENTKESYFNFTGKFKSEDENNQTQENQIGYDELIELRGRAMLTKKLGKDKSIEEEQTFRLNKEFAERINEIEKINIMLKKIAKKGYSENISIFIEIRNSIPKYFTDNKIFNGYEECSKYFNDILKDIDEIQGNYYRNERSQLIRYVYGRQFNLLNGCLKNILNKSLAPFLKYLTNDIVEESINLDKIEYNYDNNLGKGNKYICSLENINNFLKKFLNDSNLTLEEIYSQNLIKKEYKDLFKGLYTYLLEDDKPGEVQKGIEEHILNWFQFLTDHPPMAQTVLLCNEETTSEEISAFMYRAFLCQYHVLFMVGKIELLTPDKRQTLTGLINTLFTGRENEMKSCLAFAYSDKNATIVQYLERIRGRKKLEHANKSKDTNYLYDENVEIIYSDMSGVGKSNYIKKKIEDEHKVYIHFPFGGEFNRNDVINRLKKINNAFQLNINNPKKVAIHLDLYDSKQTDLMKDFLYSFLITKLYGQNENLFYLSKEVEIKIEIPNGFVDFFLKFPLLSMFKNKYEMTINQLPPLEIDEKIDSNIQIVCNYLKLLKENKLSDKDLYIKGVSLEPDDIAALLNLDEFEQESTRIDANSLNQKECQELINEYIGIKIPTYYQINSFINALSGQLKKFSMNYSLTAGKLIENGNMVNKPNLKEMRVKLVKGFIKNTQHFTQGAFDKLLNSQMNTYKVGVEQGNYDEDKQNDIAILALSSSEEIISFDKIKPSLIFFHEGQGQEFSIISTCSPDDQEYKELYELKTTPIIVQNEIYKFYNQEQRDEIPKELNNYRKFEQNMFLKELKDILDLKNPIFNSDKNENNKDYRSIEEIVGEYVFTADNFIKMILILLRIRENIPVIMMGETGCGKTSLIRKLSELINNGECKMKILNIHAGITDKEIVDFLYEPKREEDRIIPSIIEEAKALQEKEEEIKKEYEKKKFKYFKKKIWIFLDEINTCNSMGLICEMMTKHSCQGKPLPKSIVFIGACNPYRMVVKDEEPNGLKMPGTKERKLVYTVNPLPHSLLNFIFNFGSLTLEDEKSYIKNMIISPIESFYWKEIGNKKDDKYKEEKNIKSLEHYLSKEVFEQSNKLKEISSESITEAQSYVRDKNDVSSVSLREIRRFGIFYNFFVEYLRQKRKIFSNLDQKENFEQIDMFYTNLTDYDIYKYSINLSVYVCYYLRLTKKKFRDEFSNNMNKHFNFDFIEMPKREQQFIVNNIEMKEGIAKNRALLENIFALFVCVNAKVPLFIVGKPGCSKSLSVQLLFKSMKGEISDNFLFKSLPKLMINSYQGSLGSTSKGVLNIFKKARQILEVEKEENLEKIISMIYFDEMGLAEHSPHNPLKVIHAELEYDLNEGSKKIAFVGISNWRLDASKMNRGLYLSIPKPDLEDLKHTAQTIAESYNKELAQEHKDLFETLAVTYHDYKEVLLKNYTKKEDFHGSRDFYHLIKNAMRSLLRKAKEEQDMNIDQHIIETIGINSLERNFGGLEFNDKKTSLEIVKSLFKRKYENCPLGKKYDVINRIKENINDKGSRYLLLISKSSISNYLLSTILSDKNVNKDSSIYIGSRFIKDQSSEEYTLKILNKIQIQMEQNKVLLLTDLEPVYPALYDLFNQNFTVVSDKNYARIAIGSSNNTFSLVNDEFKCIVLVDQNVIDFEEPPFLNRFEKHIISFEYLLTIEMNKAAEDIYTLIQDLVKIHLPEEDKFKISYDIKKLLVNCDKEEIQGIIYSKYRELQMEGRHLQIQDLQDYVLEKISLTLPQDIVLLIKYSGFQQKYNIITDKIIKYYNQGEHNNLYRFIQKMENPKNVVYTFTNIEEPLLYKIPETESFDTKMFGKINKNSIIYISISSLSAENELEAEIEKFYINDNKKIFVFKFNPEETDLMNYIKFFIENHIKEKNYDDEAKNIKKAFIFTVHMNRIFESDKNDPKKAKYIERNELGELISHLSDFYQIFIDNLNEEDISLINIMNIKEEELYRKCLNLDEEFMKNIYNTFSYFNYKFVMDIPFLKSDKYSFGLIRYLESEEELRKQIIECVLRQKKEKKDIFIDILKNNYLKREDECLIKVIRNYLSVSFNEDLAQFIFKSEKDHFLSTFLFNKLYKKNRDNVEGNDNKLEDKINENEINTDAIIINKEGNEKIEEEKNENGTKEINYNKNQLIQTLIKYYLETVNTQMTGKFTKKIKKNNLTILLGFKLPGIRYLLNCFRAYVNSGLTERYYQKEKEIRFISQEDEDYMKEVDDCKIGINNINKNMETEINKSELFQKLKECKASSEDIKKFFGWLLDDYYLLFLSNILQIKKSFNDIEDYKNILKKMVNIRFGDGMEGNDPIKDLAKIMIWLESNNQFISIILDIYQKLSIQEKNLFNKIEKIIDNKEVQYEISKRSPQFTEQVNSSFFLIIESLLKIITSDYDIYKNLKNEEFYDFINSLKIIVQNSLKLFNELAIFPKEVFTIQEFLVIQENLNLVNKSNIENLLKVLKILSDQAKFTNAILDDETKYKDLSQNIQNLYDFLLENLGDTDIFANLILNICVDELKKIENENYRKKLVEIVLSKPAIILKSYPFISVILKGLIDMNVGFILENLINIEKDNKLYLDPINKANSEALNEIIISIFESQFNTYFESISIPKLSKEELEQCYPKFWEYYTIHNKENPCCILYDTSLDLFKNCLLYLEGILYKEKQNKIEKNKNELICKLFCIAYIKMYLYKCIYYSFHNNKDFQDFKLISDVIEGNAKNKFRKMMGVYIFKIFFFLLNNNYEEFAHYHYSNHGINFYEEFQENFKENKKTMLTYYLLPIGVDYEKYEEEAKIFEDYRLNKFEKPFNKFKELIEKNGIDIFYIISSNSIVSNLALPDYVLKNQEYSKYSSFIKSLFDQQLQIPEISKKLFLLFSNDEEYNTKIKPKLILQDVAEINKKSFEILLYSLRFCLLTTDHDKPDGFLYAQIFTEQYSTKLNENCIPGNNLLDNIKVNNYFDIENHLKTKPDNNGAYVCSCGLYYDIPPCGFPMRPKDKKPTFCPNCNERIGYEKKPNLIPGKHGMVRRDGHYRIFRDEKHKNKELAHYGDTDQNIPNRILAVYKSEEIDPILEKSKYGINKISKIRFIQKNIITRKLSQVGYRLLNFILYSHLFFANCLGIISDEEMNKYVCDGMTYLEMLETDWNLLKDGLQSKGVEIIQIFMNMIFTKISDKLKNCKEIKTSEERDEFEEDIEKILEESYKEYKEYSKKYSEINFSSLKLEKDNMKSLVLEINDIKDYDEEEYPFYKFLLMTTYPSKENFVNELKKVPDFERKYPLLNSYAVIENKEKNLLKFLPDFNEFTNFMIDNYSYNISREEAGKTILKEEEIYKNNIHGFVNRFKKFKDIWVYLKKYAIKFGCRDEMSPIDLDEYQYLAYFLNDDGEIGKGMYIAAAFQNFIIWQNQFLDSLIEPLKQNGILHHYIENMGKNIDVQNAKKNEILNFDEVNKKFIEIIFDNSKRNIYIDNDIINYKDYKKVIYNFDSIENTLGEMILPGKVKFNGIESLRFVTYTFEGFRGSKTSVLSDFLKKYKSKNLTPEKKQKIYEGLKDKLENINDELSKILFSIQLLIYYLTQDEKDPNTEIKEVIKELPYYVNISKECIDFFENQNLEVNEIFGVYSYFELLCFKPIVNNLRGHYKKRIDEKVAENINKSFEEKKFKIITKISLASACRKLISRYLVSIRDDTDYNEKNELGYYLNNEELWDKEIWEPSNNDIESELQILNKNELTLGQCFELYNLLGGDESEAYKDIIIQNEDDKQENDIPKEEENAKFIKRKKRKPNY